MELKKNFNKFLFLKVIKLLFLTVSIATKHSFWYFSRLTEETMKTARSFAVVLLSLIFALFIALPSFGGKAAESGHIFRYPDIHKDTIVFVYGGDIWKGKTTGGPAERLTTNDGEELFPKISNDGKMIAFSGQYDGNTDIYTMNMFGGEITRVTYHPGSDTVVGWDPVKNKIIFSSTRNSFGRYTNLYLINPDGTGLEKLIMHEAAWGSFSADGSKIAYNKVAREHRTWKRYKGGLAQDIFIYDLKSNIDKRITKFRGTDRSPVWIGEEIYFTSDRNGTLNLYSYNTETGKITRKTSHKKFDVRRASAGPANIIYEHGGTLKIFDPVKNLSYDPGIKILADAPETRPYIKNVKNFITSFDCSPSGKRALITARGEIFTVPEKDGPTRNISSDCGSNDKDGIWSPDGKRIAFISDRSGEHELYIVDSLGNNKPIRLTEYKDGYRQNLLWSPDGKMLIFADQTLSFYIVEISTKKITKVDKAEYENVDIDLKDKPIYDYSWSPDSRFIAYSKMDSDLVTKIYIYSVEKKVSECVSNGTFNDFHPVFSKDGKHLIFVSHRYFNPVYGDFDWEMVYKNSSGIYSISLTTDAPPLLPFMSDESGELKEKKKSTSKIITKIDFDGISERIEKLPVPPSNYRKLTINSENIFYLNSDKGDYNRFQYRSLGPRNLCAFSLKTRKEKILVKGVSGYKLSSKGTHLAFKKGKSIGIMKAVVKGKEKIINLSKLKMKIDPKKEWNQLYNETWRFERDFYYEPAMKGNDWKAIGNKYGELLKSASYRGDVGYLIGEMIGELSTSHTYVFGGDKKRKAERTGTGMLGVDWKIDKKNNLYRFGKIYRTPDWTRNVIPPLTGPGRNVEEGDYLLKINGKDVNTKKNIYMYFEDKADEVITITTNSKPILTGAKQIKVKTIRGEYTLRYQDWVEQNRKKVEKSSGGKIGYIHFPDTFNGTAREFPKYFLSQLTKKGLIIDGRYNGGGLDPSIFLRRLNRKIHSYWTRRYSTDQISPPNAINAHMVLLTNKQAGSGGDELPFVFKTLKMGPVIGTRTWGGLVGVSMFIKLMDGGGITAPDYRIYDTKGKWIIENYGVDPDIPIDNDSLKMSGGIDSQLETGIKYILEKLKKVPIVKPEHESFIIEKR